VARFGKSDFKIDVWCRGGSSQWV